MLSGIEPEPVPVGIFEVVELGNVYGAVVELGDPDATSVLLKLLLLGTCPVAELDWLEVSGVVRADEEGAPETVELGRRPVLLPTEVEFCAGYGAELVPVSEEVPLLAPEGERVPVVT